MTQDEYILRLARRINVYQQKILDLVDDIRESDHPNAEQIANNLEENMFVSASAVHCAHDHFLHPEKWKLDGFDIRRKRADEE